MLQPARTKYRKQQKGRNTGVATRGNKVSFGEYGLKAIGRGRLTGRSATPVAFVPNRKNSPALPPQTLASALLGHPETPRHARRLRQTSRPPRRCHCPTSDR